MDSMKRNDSVCSRFVFDNSVMNETIVTLHGLNCEKQSLNSLLTSVIFIGYSLGSLVGGVLSDRIGRILTIKILTTAFLILSATFIFTTNLVVYGIIRTLQVATFIGSFGPSITYIFEIFGPEHRSKVTTLITGAPTSVGYSLVALFAQLTRDWWWTMMCLIIITLLFPILLHFFVPESFLFLESKGRSYEARKVLEKFPKRRENLELEKFQPDMDYYNSIGSFASIQLPTKNKKDEAAGEIGGIPGLFGDRFMIANFSFLVIVW